MCTVDFIVLFPKQSPQATAVKGGGYFTISAVLTPLCLKHADPQVSTLT